MQERTRNRLAVGIKWAFLAPLAVVLLTLNVLNWTTNSAWVQEASRYILNAVILGFAGILAVQALQPPPKAKQNR
jgi:hypothetical protein